MTENTMKSGCPKVEAYGNSVSVERYFVSSQVNNLLLKGFIIIGNSFRSKRRVREIFLKGW